MNTNQVADVLVRIVPDIEVLMNDIELAEKIKGRQKSDDESEAAKLGMSTMLGLATYMLDKHRAVAFNIIGAINGKTSDDIGKQGFAVTVKQITEVLGDSELLSFFTASEKSEPETSSESSPE